MSIWRGGLTMVAGRAATGNLSFTSALAISELAEKIAEGEERISIRIVSGYSRWVILQTTKWSGGQRTSPKYVKEELDRLTEAGEGAGHPDAAPSRLGPRKSKGDKPKAPEGDWFGQGQTKPPLDTSESDGSPSGSSDSEDGKGRKQKKNKKKRKEKASDRGPFGAGPRVSY